jgi:hypothetical protein
MILYPDYRKKPPARAGIYIFGGKNSRNEPSSKLYFINTTVLPHIYEEITTKGK